MTVRLALASGAATAMLAGCGSTPHVEPPRPTAVPVAVDPCSLITLDGLEQATGTTYATGAPEVFHGPTPGSGCVFSPAAPAPVTTALAVPDEKVRITLITRAEFDHAAGFFGSPSFAVHPVSLRGADAAVELVGPDLGTVYARRMDLVFAVDVSRGKGEDTAAEERIATIVLIHR